MCRGENTQSVLKWSNIWAKIIAAGKHRIVEEVKSDIRFADQKGKKSWWVPGKKKSPWPLMTGFHPLHGMWEQGHCCACSTTGQHHFWPNSSKMTKLVRPFVSISMQIPPIPLVIQQDGKRHWKLNAYLCQFCFVRMGSMNPYHDEYQQFILEMNVKK